MEIKPAIIVVAYDRAKSLSRLLDSLNKAVYSRHDIPLIISIDFSISNEDVIKIANQFEWPYGKKTVVTHKENLGLRKHILECGGYSFKYGSVIILEDDLFVSGAFYDYVVQAQSFYSCDNSIAGISLYSYSNNIINGKKFYPIKGATDVYMGQFCVTWGQSWTKKQWKMFIDWYEEHPVLLSRDDVPNCVTQWSDNSWGKYFAHYMVDCDKYYVIPYNSFSTCFSEKGVHTGMTNDDIQVDVSPKNKVVNYGIKNTLVVYNTFFVFEGLVEYLPIPGGKSVCVDIYETNNDIYNDYDYVLSTKRLPHRVISSYGANLKPLELNVMYDIPGKSIFLYDMCQKDILPNRDDFELISYEMPLISVKTALKYAFGRAYRVIKNAIFSE